MNTAGYVLLSIIIVIVVFILSLGIYFWIKHKQGQFGEEKLKQKLNKLNDNYETLAKKLNQITEILDNLLNSNNKSNINDAKDLDLSKPKEESNNRWEVIKYGNQITYKRTFEDNENGVFNLLKFTKNYETINEDKKFYSCKFNDCTISWYKNSNKMVLQSMDEKVIKEVLQNLELQDNY